MASAGRESSIGSNSTFPPEKRDSYLTPIDSYLTPIANGWNEKPRPIPIDRSLPAQRTRLLPPSMTYSDPLM